LSVRDFLSLAGIIISFLFSAVCGYETITKWFQKNTNKKSEAVSNFAFVIGFKEFYLGNSNVIGNAY